MVTLLSTSNLRWGCFSNVHTSGGGHVAEPWASKSHFNFYDNLTINYETTKISLENKVTFVMVLLILQNLQISTNFQKF